MVRMPEIQCRMKQSDLTASEILPAFWKTPQRSKYAINTSIAVSRPDPASPNQPRLISICGNIISSKLFFTYK